MEEERRVEVKWKWKWGVTFSNYSLTATLWLRLPPLFFFFFLAIPLRIISFSTVKRKMIRRAGTLTSTQSLGSSTTAIHNE